MYAKKGKSSSVKKTQKMSRNQETGNVYFYKPDKNVDMEKRHKQLNGSYYGKKPAPEFEPKGTYDSPAKTMRSP